MATILNPRWRCYSALFKRASVNLKYHRYETILFLTALKSCGKCIQVLKEESDVNIQNRYGFTTRSRIVYKRHLSTVIDGRGDVNTKNHSGTRTASRQNNRFVDTKTSAGFEETRVGPRACDELLLQAGIDVNLKDICTETIIEVKTDVNARNRMGETTLMMVVRHGDENAIANLIAAGADVNIQNNRGETALVLASSWCNSRIFKLFIRAGADVNIRSILRSPLKLIEKLKLVYCAGAYVNMVVVDGNFVVRNRDKINDILKVMFVAGENIDQAGYTAMQVKRELNMD